MGRCLETYKVAISQPVYKYRLNLKKSKLSRKLLISSNQMDVLALLGLVSIHA